MYVIFLHDQYDYVPAQPPPGCAGAGRRADVVQQAIWSPVWIPRMGHPPRRRIVGRAHEWSLAGNVPRGLSAPHGAFSMAGGRGYILRRSLISRFYC